LGFRVGPSRNFEFPLCKHEMVCLRSGKCKDPPISHSFFFLMANFLRLMKKKGYKLSKGIFLQKKPKFATFGGEKKVLELAILRA
jgi:hypothetical protein